MTSSEYLSLPTKQRSRRSPVQAESKLQQAAVRWFLTQYPQHRNCFFSIPNEGARTPTNGARIKAMGRLKGMVDLCLAIQSKGYGALYVEMKHGKGKESPEQNQVMNRLRHNGYSVHVCRSLEEFMDVVKDYLS